MICGHLRHRRCLLQVSIMRRGSGRVAARGKTPSREDEPPRAVHGSDLIAPGGTDTVTAEASTR